MIFLIALAMAALFAWLCARPLKQYPKLFYIAAVVISLLVSFCTFSGITNEFADWFLTWVWFLFSRGTFATALFVVVMYTGTLPNGSAPIKKLMPIRAELSIIASILTLGHNISYGKTYFLLLFTQPDRLPIAQLTAAVLSILMIGIMLPLMIISFPSVRRKMNGRRWKRLQRSAYVFYAMIYFHVLLLTIPAALAGRAGYTLTVLSYSVVFLGYAAMRTRKALKKNCSVLCKIPGIAALCAFILICVTIGFSKNSTAAGNTTDEKTKSMGYDSDSKYRDGTYIGSGNGYAGEITVSVNIQNGVLTDVTVTGSTDDEPYWSDAKTVINQILSMQSPEVDTVTGATYSSAGIIKAVRNALDEAEN